VLRLFLVILHERLFFVILPLFFVILAEGQNPEALQARPL